MTEKSLKSFYVEGYGLIVVSVLLRAINPVFFKVGALNIDSFTIVEVCTNIFYFLGFTVLFVRTIVWQLTLSRFPLSYAYPFLSVSFILILIAGHFIFNEPVRISNILGSLIIMVGLIVMSRRGGDASL